MFLLINYIFSLHLNKFTCTIQEKKNNKITVFTFCVKIPHYDINKNPGNKLFRRFKAN